MKKKNIIISVILLAVICIAKLNETSVRYIYYNYIKDKIFELQGKTDVIYDISVNARNVEVILSDGMQKKIMQPQNYYSGFGNFIYNYENGHYYISLYESDEIYLKADKYFGFSIRVDFPDGYTVCRDLDLHAKHVKSLNFIVDKECIICESEENLAEYNVGMWFGYSKGSLDDQVMFGKMDFEIHSFEIRQKEDGTTTAFLDLDGDGIYEHDCSKYTYEYWQKRGLE